MERRHSCVFILVSLLLFSVVGRALNKTDESTHGVVCREPNDEIAADERLHRKFLLFGGEGGGLGNFLIFFPSGYYFAALTGREIVIIDNSLLGEVCKVVLCGYPFLSTMTEAYPEYFSENNMQKMRGLKAMDFHNYFENWPSPLQGLNMRSQTPPVPPYSHSHPDIHCQLPLFHR